MQSSKEETVDDKSQPLRWLLNALKHAAPATCGSLLVGTALSSLRARQLKAPGDFFVAAGVGCGVFRILNYREEPEDGNSKLAAALGSIVFFRLLTDGHKHIVLFYAVIEAALQYYAHHRVFPAIIEQAAGVAVTSRLMYTWVFHSDWLLPSHLCMLDAQSAMNRNHLALLRKNISLPSNNAVPRCEWLHPNSSCTDFAMHSVQAVCKRSIKVFVPLQGLSVAWTLATKKRIDVQKTLVDFTRSVAFLTGNYCFPYIASCLLPQANHQVMMSIASLTPFLAQYAEPPKRRMAILKAIAAYSLISVFYQVKSWMKGSNWSRARVVSVATILYAGCMTYLLQMPHKQSHAIIYFLYGRSMREKSKDSSSQLAQHEN
ncbi:unnamed protein product [Aphanomyces euteiches]